MTSSGRKHQRSENERALVSASDTSMRLIASIREAIESIPHLADDAVQQALRLVTDLPEQLALDVLKIIMNKLASDFALRYVDILRGALAIGHEGEIHLDLLWSQDEALLHSLLEPWTHAPTTLRIHSLEQVEQFANITAGLQRMIDASLPKGLESWLFDAGPQYHAMLVRTEILPEAVLTAYPVAGADGTPGIWYQIASYGSERTSSSTGAWRWSGSPGRTETAASIQPSSVVIEADAGQEQDVGIAVA